MPAADILKAAFDGRRDRFARWGALLRCRQAPTKDNKNSSFHCSLGQIDK